MKVNFTNKRPSTKAVYKNKIFASKLEVRYAVLFDSLGWKWMYELNVYKLINRLRYLPDFYLPEQRMWVEIKGYSPNDEAITKMHYLVQKTRVSGVICSGLPSPYCIQWYSSIEKDSVAVTYGNSLSYSMRFTIDGIKKVESDQEWSVASSIEAHFKEARQYEVKGVY